MDTPQEPKSSSQLSSRYPSITVSLVSYGRSNGPFVPSDEQKEKAKFLSFNIRHLPNPPRNLRAMTTGLSPRLQKEFLKNEVVQQFLTRTHDEIVASLKDSYEALSRRDELIHNETGEGLEGKTGGASEDADISFIVTVCCEEGRHRSVAFVEELAQRLIRLRTGDVMACWELNVNVVHRDIGGLVPGSSDLTMQQTKAKERGKGGKDARRTNQRKNAFGDFNEII